MLLSFQNDASHVIYLNPAHVVQVLASGDNRSAVTMVNGEKIAVQGSAMQVADRLNSGLTGES
jgi:uncharacterized protein YlzI (FlbEa/FlbD family)